MMLLALFDGYYQNIATRLGIDINGSFGFLAKVLGIGGIIAMVLVVLGVIMVILSLINKIQAFRVSLATSRELKRLRAERKARKGGE